MVVTVLVGVVVEGAETMVFAVIAAEGTVVLIAVAAASVLYVVESNITNLLCGNRNTQCCPPLCP